MIQSNITTHFIIFVIVIFTSLVLSNKFYQTIWKPICITLLIGVFTKISTNFSKKEIIMIINMGLLGYLNGILYIEHYDTFASILTFFIMYINFFNITNNNFSIKNILIQRELNSILITRTMMFIIVLGFTLLIIKSN